MYVATLAAPIIERPVACVSDASARHLHHLTKFRDNFECLRDKMNELVALKEDVKRRIKVVEDNHQMERTHMVAQWLQTAEALQQEVDLISPKCFGEIEQKCCGDSCPKKWWIRYKLGKKVCKKLKDVVELISEGNFELWSLQTLVQPECRVVGLQMNELPGEVWSRIADDHIKIIGIFGMGGVGKTTLLKTININAFEKEASNFDLVIWVVVSSQVSLQSIQKQVAMRLGLAWSEDDEHNDKARHVFNVLSKKRFLLLLDDVWERLDLEAIGIPSLHTSSNNSKLVFTTRSEQVCGDMQISKKYKVHVLEWEQAWELFQQNVGEDTLNHHPEIPKLAKAVAEKCGCLPLALITTGRAMASLKTPHEWNHALTTLNRHAADFPGMENKVLSILKFSYDILEDDIARKCFLYFSLYPEDYDIEIKDIIYYWIGEEL